MILQQGRVAQNELGKLLARPRAPLERDRTGFRNRLLGLAGRPPSVVISPTGEGYREVPARRSANHLLAETIARSALQ